MNKIDINKLVDLCLLHKKSLTPTRAVVITTLSKHKKPKSAYDLQEEINLKVNNKINISTIYRVLDFWMKLGLVHKIASINKFLLCIRPKDKHTHMLNYCTKCEEVFETCNEHMGLNFIKSTKKLNLSLDKNQSIEIPVLCTSCN